MKRSGYLLLYVLVGLLLMAPCASALRVSGVSFGGTFVTGSGSPVTLPSLAPSFSDVPQTVNVTETGLTIAGYVSYSADPWFNYDLTFTNTSDSPETFDLSWNPSATNPPFTAGSATFEAIVSGGTASPNGPAMQTVIFPAIPTTTFSQQTVDCVNMTCGSSSTVPFSPAASFTSYTVDLDFTLSAGAAAEMIGDVGLATPEPAGFQLLGMGLVAMGLGRGLLRRARRNRLV